MSSPAISESCSKQTTTQMLSQEEGILNIVTAALHYFSPCKGYNRVSVTLHNGRAVVLTSFLSFQTQTASLTLEC